MSTTITTDPYKPVTCNLTRVQGDDTPFRWLSKVNGVAVPNSGYAYKMEGSPISEPADETDQQFAMTYTGTGDGVISMSPSAEEVDHVGTIFYHVRQTDGASKTRTIIAGKITFVPKRVDPGT
jgi:hypothetical protein